LSTQPEFFGFYWYDNVCRSCHDDPEAYDPKSETFLQGTWFNFGTAEDPAYIGTVANENPWEFFHKMRFGHPGTPMPRLELLGWTADQAARIGAFAATLPTE
jgi:thiosulfate dehydrogenase